MYFLGGSQIPVLVLQPSLQQLSRGQKRKLLQLAPTVKAAGILTSRDVPFKRFIWSSCHAVGREMYSGSILTYSVHGPETLNLVLGSAEALVTCISKKSITSPRNDCVAISYAFHVIDKAHTDISTNSLQDLSKMLINLCVLCNSLGAQY